MKYVEIVATEGSHDTLAAIAAKAGASDMRAGAIYARRILSA